ncbi:hypothetical protein Acor_03840 [Acrocarpospora corrugata]|uniref:Carbon monoxide dehydrogenase subunit G n=1 Tax=Acrocarpospora corrugata TaxID=35763 RepID=A0A5M3VTA7_9ACTN|nr:carbon monoxide dehydrogenase subunit G [Acrocarpospora corrugata]GER98322.1 hypothetical protein Acor_03840 [Acrocarpospora corrugata]
MKVIGSALLGVERAKVWSALQDPGVLVRTIPGCERLEAIGVDTYRMTVSAGVASIKGVYQGEVALAEPDEPESFVLRARGQGAPGTVDATVTVRLSEVEGGTRIDYDAEAVVGGMIGGVGQRMLGSVARKTAGEFFSAVEEHLLSGPAVVPAAALNGIIPHEVLQPEAGQVFTRTAQTTAKQGAPPWAVITAFGMGAGIALGSAVIGWLLGRSGRR